MIPILYESNETAFSSNGLGRLRDCISCQVTEERNGVYECNFAYPVDGANYDLIQPGRIIAVTHDDVGDVQPFDIIGYERPLNGVVTFHAVHISYRLTGHTVYGTNINTLTDAISLFNGAGTPFYFMADYNSTAFMASADGVPRSVRQMMGGIEGSILDAYGGEWEYDRWNVALHSSRGVRRDMTVRYGVNLLDYNEEADFSGEYNAVVPYWIGQGTDGNQVVIRGNKVSSGAILYNGRDVIIPLDLSDKFEDQPTIAQLETMASTLMAARRPELPSRNIKVDFVRLQDMEEFSEFAPLMSCRLCDTINVVFPRYQMSGHFKIVRVVWDVLQDKYSGMELGELSTSLAQALGLTTSAENLNSLKDLSISGDLTVGGDVVLAHDPTTAMEAATKQYVDSFDHVIESGIKSGWRYIKWSSGRYELWTSSGTLTSVALTTSMASGVYSTSSWANRSFPLPNDVISVIYADSSVESNGYTLTQVSSTNTTQVAVRVWGSYAQTITMNVRIHVIGLWQ